MKLERLFLLKVFLAVKLLIRAIAIMRPEGGRWNKLGSKYRELLKHLI